MGKYKLPTFTDEERRRNAKLAMAARRERAELKKSVATGELAFSDALADDRAQRIPVKALLGSVPGIGPVKSERIMLALRIAPSRRVKGLGVRQREALLAAEANGWKFEC